jgi:hypothetical protein
MQLNRIRQVPVAIAIAAVMAFAAACSGTNSSLSPTSPSGVAASASSSSAVSGAMGFPTDPPCDPTKETCEDPPCDPTKETCEDPPCDPTKETCEDPPCDPTKEECDPPVGDDGCTPGYWKNHLGSWSGYSPSATLTSVFGAGALGGTLLEGLSFGGGSGLDGAKRILLRAAVAALLNAASPDVDYTRTTASVIADVTAALNSNDRSTILALALALDADNNLGCPLN